MKRRIAILGSTGSIGQSALSVVDAHGDRLSVVGLAAGENSDLLAEQIAKYRPKIVSMASGPAIDRLRGSGLTGVTVAGNGREGLVAVATAPDVDIVLCASSGTEGLEAVLARRRAAGLLGASILGHPGFDFDIEIALGAGAYICGEESALIESLEGKPGKPRNRPPYPDTHGYLGQPTVVNNVETYACAALIAQRGGAWFAGLGTPQSTGTKLISVSGDCQRPGTYEYPFGVTIRQVLADCGASQPHAVQVGGPSGTCVPWRDFDRRIGFEDVPTAGAFMVFSRSRDMFEVARSFSHFFAHESCGFCTPCRVGTSLLRDTMDKLAAGKGSAYDMRSMQTLMRILLSMSHCGLGHTAAKPVVETMQAFPEAYERRLRNLDFEPAFDLDAALGTARRITGRDDEWAHIVSDQR